MDRMKDETSLEGDTAPLVSAAKEECTDIKEEEAELPAQICSVKEEVIEESRDHTTVKKEVEQHKAIDDTVEQTVKREDGNNCDTGNSCSVDSPDEATSSGIGKINPIKMTDIFPGKQHSEDAKHTLSGILIYRCGFCDRIFSLMRDLEVHILTHVGSKPYRCKICKKAFTQTGLTAHMRRHKKQKSYECEVCKKYFTRRGNLLAHKMLHFGGKRYICEVCEKPFAKMRYLNSHMRRTHTRQKPHRCEVCN